MHSNRHFQDIMSIYTHQTISWCEFKVPRSVFPPQLAVSPLQSQAGVVAQGGQLRGYIRSITVTKWNFVQEYLFNDFVHMKA